MTMLNSLPSLTERSSKRVGRGYGSGKGGHTSTRGMKGQNSRNGGKRPLWFEGGQLPLIKRLPMWRGKGKLESLNRIETVTLRQLNELDTETITLDTLKIAKVIARRATGAKIIARGRITRKITLSGIKVSKQARGMIEKSGGSVVE